MVDLREASKKREKFQKNNILERLIELNSDLMIKKERLKKITKRFVDLTEIQQQKINLIKLTKKNVGAGSRAQVITATT